MDAKFSEHTRFKNDANDRICFNINIIAMKRYGICVKKRDGGCMKIGRG